MANEELVEDYNKVMKWQRVLSNYDNFGTGLIRPQVLDGCYLELFSLPEHTEKNTMVFAEVELSIDGKKVCEFKMATRMNPEKMTANFEFWDVHIYERAGCDLLDGKVFAVYDKGRQRFCVGPTTAILLDGRSRNFRVETKSFVSVTGAHSDYTVFNELPTIDNQYSQSQLWGSYYDDVENDYTMFPDAHLHREYSLDDVNRNNDKLGLIPYIRDGKLSLDDVPEEYICYLTDRTDIRQPYENLRSEFLSSLENDLFAVYVLEKSIVPSIHDTPTNDLFESTVVIDRDIAIIGNGRSFMMSGYIMSGKDRVLYMEGVVNHVKKDIPDNIEPECYDMYENGFIVTHLSQRLYLYKCNIYTFIAVRPQKIPDYEPRYTADIQVTDCRIITHTGYSKVLSYVFDGNCGKLEGSKMIGSLKVPCDSNYNFMQEGSGYLYAFTYNDVPDDIFNSSRHDEVFIEGFISGSANPRDADMSDTSTDMYKDAIRIRVDNSECITAIVSCRKIDWNGGSYKTDFFKHPDLWSVYKCVNFGSCIYIFSRSYVVDIDINECLISPVCYRPLKGDGMILGATVPSDGHYDKKESVIKHAIYYAKTSYESQRRFLTNTNMFHVSQMVHGSRNSFDYFNLRNSTIVSGINGNFYDASTHDGVEYGFVNRENYVFEYPTYICGKYSTTYANTEKVRFSYSKNYEQWQKIYHRSRTWNTGGYNWSIEDGIKNSDFEFNEYEMLVSPASGAVSIEDLIAQGKVVREKDPLTGRPMLYDVKSRCRLVFPKEEIQYSKNTK